MASTSNSAQDNLPSGLDIEELQIERDADEYMKEQLTKHTWTN
jgi:hypothetical protein